MRIILGVRASGRLEDRATRGVLRALDVILEKKAYPKAVENAPGSLKQRIKLIHAKFVTEGIYETGLSIPSKYRPVEYGSGIYEGGSGWDIVPLEPNKVLGLEDGRHFAHVFVLGQRPQMFLHNAIRDALVGFEQEIVYGINS